MEIAIENDLNISARRQKRTMALRSRLITYLNHLFTSMNDMSSDDNLSNEDVNHSISLTLAQSDSDSLHLTRFNKIAIQGTPQMAVDKEAISLSRVYSHDSKYTCPYSMCNPP